MNCPSIVFQLTLDRRREKKTIRRSHGERLTWFVLFFWMAVYINVYIPVLTDPEELTHTAHCPTKKILKGFLFIILAFCGGEKKDVRFACCCHLRYTWGLPARSLSTDYLNYSCVTGSYAHLEWGQNPLGLRSRRKRTHFTFVSFDPCWPYSYGRRRKTDLNHIHKL